jgi:hypothetical protein
MDALIAAAAALLLAGPAGPPAPPVTIPPASVEELVGKLADRAPFVESREANEERATLNHYFRKEDYAALRGNPIVGYWDRGGFRWTGDRIAFGGIGAGAASATRISGRAWEAAFRHVAQGQGLRVDEGAPLRIEGRCVAAVVDVSEREPVPGVLLEVRVISAQGILRHRVAVGKPTVEEAMAAALDFLLRFARSVGTDGKK